MTNAELLQLNPQHIDELRSFFVGLPFDDAEIIAKETVPSEYSFTNPISAVFANEFQKLTLDGIFRGKNSNHAVFSSEEDDTFYCISIAKIEQLEERILFKLTRR